MSDATATMVDGSIEANLPPWAEAEAEAGPGPSAEAEALGRITEKRERVREARREHEDLAEQAKAAKKRLEARQEELEATIDAAARALAPLPLFDRPGPVEADGPATWREAPLSGLGLADAILTSLAEHAPPILTLGHLADYTSRPGYLLTDIRGIGPAKAEAIDEATAAYWAARGGEADGATDPEA